ncbi:MAG: hypothetical protein ACXW3D_01060 [Caulobacteraceae bacterium]
MKVLTSLMLGILLVFAGASVGYAQVATLDVPPTVDPAAASASDTAKKRKPQEVIVCKTYTPMGTRIPGKRKLCGTGQEFDNASHKSRKWVEDIVVLSSHTGNCPNTGGVC